MPQPILDVAVEQGAVGGDGKVVAQRVVLLPSPFAQFFYQRETEQRLAAEEVELEHGIGVEVVDTVYLLVHNAFSRPVGHALAQVLVLLETIDAVQITSVCQHERTQISRAFYRLK